MEVCTGNENTITLNQFNLFFATNNKSIVDATTITIHREIDSAISNFGKHITQKIDMLYHDETQINQEVKALDYQIGTMTLRLNKH